MADTVSIDIPTVLLASLIDLVYQEVGYWKYAPDDEGLMYPACVKLLAQLQEANTKLQEANK